MKQIFPIPPFKFSLAQFIDFFWSNYDLRFLLEKVNFERNTANAFIGSFEAEWLNVNVLVYG